MYGISHKQIASYGEEYDTSEYTAKLAPLKTQLDEMTAKRKNLAQVCPKSPTKESYVTHKTALHHAPKSPASPLKENY